VYMSTFYKLSGVFIIILALVFSVGQVGITKVFNYPQILRAPVDIILPKYKEGGGKLKFFWICNVFGGLMQVPLSLMFYKIVSRNDTPYLIIGAALGMASGIFYVIGFMRWVFLADNLSSKYVNENTNDDIKQTIQIVFESFHIYCGNSIGETMGFLCMGTWFIILGIAMFHSVIFSTLIGVGFIACGVGILVGPLEWLGFKFFNKINKVAMKILMVLLIYVGIKLIVY